MGSGGRSDLSWGDRIGLFHLRASLQRRAARRHGVTDRKTWHGHRITVLQQRGLAACCGRVSSASQQPAGSTTPFSHHRIISWELARRARMGGAERAGACAGRPVRCSTKNEEDINNNSRSAEDPIIMLLWQEGGGGRRRQRARNHCRRLLLLLRRPDDDCVVLAYAYESCYCIGERSPCCREGQQRARRERRRPPPGRRGAARWTLLGRSADAVRPRRLERERAAHRCRGSPRLFPLRAHRSCCSMAASHQATA